MAAFNFYDPAPVFQNMLGIEPRVNGELQFYEIGTTTPKSTWSDPDLTILNANPVILDGSGRATTNIFLDGDYDVKISDSGGANPITRSIVSGEVAGQTVPPLETGEFLTNDGSSLLWAAIRQLPDATASVGQVPVTNGGGPSGYTLQNLTTSNTIITFVTGGIKLSNGTTARMIQFGTDTVSPASGTFVGSKLITFGTAFSAPPQVFVELNARANAGGGIPAHLVESIAVGSANLLIDTNGFNNITQAVAFSYFAIGTVAP